MQKKLSKEHIERINQQFFGNKNSDIGIFTKYVKTLLSNIDKEEGALDSIRQFIPDKYEFSFLYNFIAYLEASENLAHKINYQTKKDIEKLVKTLATMSKNNALGLALKESCKNLDKSFLAEVYQKSTFEPIENFYNKAGIEKPFYKSRTVGEYIAGDGQLIPEFFIMDKILSQENNLNKSLISLESKKRSDGMEFIEKLIHELTEKATTRYQKERDGDKEYKRRSAIVALLKAIKHIEITNKINIYPKKKSYNNSFDEKLVEFLNIFLSETLEIGCGPCGSSHQYYGA